MTQPLRRYRSYWLIAILLFTLPRPARAGTLKTDAELIIVSVALTGAAIGVGTYFLVRQPPAITGCAVSTADGLVLTNEGNGETFSLIGDLSAVKSGDRVKVSGKKRKKDASGKRAFLVEKFKKDYGACKLLPECAYASEVRTRRIMSR